MIQLLTLITLLLTDRYTGNSKLVVARLVLVNGRCWEGARYCIRAVLLYLRATHNEADECVFVSARSLHGRVQATGKVQLRVLGTPHCNTTTTSTTSVIHWDPIPCLSVIDLGSNLSSFINRVVLLIDCTTDQERCSIFSGCQKSRFQLCPISRFLTAAPKMETERDFDIQEKFLICSMILCLQ